LEFDWLVSTNAQRKLLYQFVKRRLDRQNKSTNTLHFDLFGTHQGPNYDKTFQSGRYSTKKATPYFDWLKKTDEIQANKLLAELNGSNDQTTDKNPENDASKSTIDHSVALTDGQKPNHSAQPRISLWLAEPSDETRFLYRSRSIPFIGAEEPFQQLDTFRNCPGTFMWHVIQGPGGTGKSRLALEYTLELNNQKKWKAGFLDMDHAETFDWQEWQPDQPNFLIVDYAGRTAGVVADMLRVLSMRSDLSPKVRILLLERNITGAWFNRITWRGHQENHLVEKTWFDADGALEPPDDVWSIIQHMCREDPTHLPEQDHALFELERIDNQLRPLFAAFLGDAYFRQQNPRNWDTYALVENVLEHEKRYWEAGSIDHQHINLCASATSTGGIPGEWLSEFSKTMMKGFWPNWQGNQTLETLSAIYGDTLVDDIPPLEPDILGEVFFLQQWKSASRHERKHLIIYGAMLAPWFASFLERLASDFPVPDVLNLLKTVLAADFGEYSNSKSELLYNIVTATAKTHPEIAMQVYRLFATFGTPGHEDYHNECFLDASHNLIVGIPKIHEKEAFEIYNLQKDQVKQLPLVFDRTRAGIGLSILGLFPLGNSQQFRAILADTIRTHRRHPDDKIIRQEVSTAIANYVNLLDITQIMHAKNMLHLFRKIAQSNHENDMEDAWAAILYHIFLLLMLEENEAAEINETTKANTFKKLTHLAPETSKYENQILTLLENDTG